MTGLGRYFKTAAVGLAVALVAVQLVPVTHTNPPVGGDVAAPAEVAALLRRACYDCHSNETVWPWYSRVAPASWLVSHDVEEGREELNFSTWADYSAKRRAKKLKETAEEVSEGEMPPWYYVLLHPEARLDDAERTRLLAWTADAGAAPGR
jgi:cytochrome c551/c552